MEKTQDGDYDLILRLETNHSELIAIVKSVDRILSAVQHELMHLRLLHERIKR